MKKYFKNLGIILAVLGLSTVPTFAQQKPDDILSAQIHKQFIDNFIVAKLKVFNVEAAKFNTATHKTCIAEKLTKQFKATVAAWMPLQSSRFDAFEKNNRSLRIYFWPNSRGEKQVKKMLLAMDRSKIETSYFGGISVAVQGLPIVEWLLFHKDSTLNSGDISLKTYSCDFLKAISQNIVSLSDALIFEFTQGDNRNALLNPSAESAIYNERAEITLQFFKSIHAMVELVHGQKLSRPTGKELKNLRPKRLEMWRSGQTKNNLYANINGIYDGYKIFAPLVVAGKNGKLVDVEIRQAFNKTILLIDALPNDLYAALVGDNKQIIWAQNQVLITQLTALRRVLEVKATDALGIPLGFNALDGD
ncbi:MAG: imelysin family protein [Rhizobiales bacterium]|nr:imelysin family protein [Hyphomicrobiales bacterium]